MKLLIDRMTVLLEHNLYSLLFKLVQVKIFSSVPAGKICIRLELLTNIYQAFRLPFSLIFASPPYSPFVRTMK